MHGGRIIAMIHSEKERESAEPKRLVEPFLAHFMGKVQDKDDRLTIVPDHPFLKDAVPCRAARGLNHEFEEGDWTVAEICHHPLKDGRPFYAELTQCITFGNDHFAPWWVTLARHNLEKEAPDGVVTKMLNEGLVREDLTVLDFVTIDSANTENMDGTLFAKTLPDDKFRLIVAIADPTAWIAEGGKLDKTAEIHALANYLPGFNTPMLPRELSDNLYSLHANEVRLVLARRMILSTDGTVEDNIEFFATTIKSKAKLVYDQVSDWLENTDDWQPESEAIAEQVRLLAQIYQRRDEWRYNHALVSKDRPDYRFILSEKGEVLDIVTELRRIANRIVEETMIAASVCATCALRDRLGFNIHDVHIGFDPANAGALAASLKTHDLYVGAKEVLALDGFCKLRRELDAQPTGFLDSRIRRLRSFAEISTEPDPRFGLGLEAYATWTSPIRKYGDMINHRLLKAVIKGETTTRPQDEITVQMTERHRLNRMAERDVGDWLHVCFLKDKAGTGTRFAAEIVDISRGGIRVRLVDSDAITSIPAPFLRAMRGELVYSQENGAVQIKGETVYKVADVIDVTVAGIRTETRDTITRPVA